MSRRMRAAVGVLWLGDIKTRYDLSSAAYLRKVDPARTFSPPPRFVTGNGKLTESLVRGRPVLRWEPKDRIVGRELIYFAGGCLVNPPAIVHWWILREIAARTKAAITMPVYPLAPEHTAADARPFVDEVYDDIAARAETRELFVAGDSAGGNIGTTLALRVRDERRRRIDGLVLISPWLDVTMSNPGAWAREQRDPILRCEGLRAAGVAWAGEEPMDSPQISPLGDALDSLPPTLLFQGENDVFYDDAVAFAAKAREAGSPVRIVTAADGFHVYLGATVTREARKAYDLIARFFDDPAAVAR